MDFEFTGQESSQQESTVGGTEFVNMEENNGQPLQNNNEIQPTSDPSNFENQGQNNFEQNEIDEEEQKRIQERENEANERRKKIEEKINLELEKKNELRNKAVEFMNDFEEKRKEAIELRKKQNIQNEQDALNNKQLVKEGKKNPWEIVTDNITVKESEYKGTKDVSRMRNVILARKNDPLPQQS